MVTYTNLVPIDVTSGDTLRATSITVEDGRIVDLHQRTSGDTIDLHGAFVTPGLIDMHVHLVWDGQPDPDVTTQREPPALATLRAARNARRTLQGGVTTVRDLGAPHDAVLGVARAIHSGVIEGPRVIAAGKPIIQTGGHVASMGREADGVDEVLKAVREQIKLGARVIKLMCSGGAYGEHEDITDTQFTVEEIQAAVQAAHAAGRRVAAHALPAAAIRNATIAGADTIEHAPLVDDETMALLAQHGTTVVPTLAPYHTMSACGPDDGVPMSAILKSRRIMQAYATHLQAYFQRGIPVALGTDAGSPNIPHPVVPHEINLWIRDAGVTPLQALQSATVHAARALQLAELGVIAVGAHADLVAYQHHPLQRPDTLHHPQSVIQAGRTVAPSRTLWSAALT